MTKIQNLILGLFFIIGNGDLPPLYGMESLVLKDQQTKECPCCNNKLKSQDDQLFTLECNHSYHTDCLKEYLDPNNDSDNQNKCRLCETPILVNFIRNNKLYKVGIINKSIECCICFDPTTDNNKACLLACSHETCVSCITRHINEKNNTPGVEPDCPVCRVAIETDFITRRLNPNFVRNPNPPQPEEDLVVLRGYIGRIHEGNIVEVADNFANQIVIDPGLAFVLQEACRRQLLPHFHSTVGPSDMG